MLGNELFPLRRRITHAKGGCQIGAGVGWSRVGPRVIVDDNPVFSLWDDNCQGAILLAFCVVVGFDQRADTAKKLVIKFVDSFWRDDADEEGNLVA